MILISTSIVFGQDVRSQIKKNLILINGGTFTMGQTDPNVSCKGCTADEQPPHKVTVSDFYLCKYEVTLKEWKQIMGTNPSYDEECENCPVDGVSWQDVQLFIKKINEKSDIQFRIPTEAEWEFAARGGNKSNGYRFSGSNNASDVAWFGLKKDQKTHQTGLKQPNELGLYDMSGNVWEWCSDFYGFDYFANSPEKDPSGPISGKDKILRGGSWYNQSFDCRVTTRYRFYPSFRTNANGFRLASSKK